MKPVAGTPFLRVLALGLAGLVCGSAGPMEAPFAPVVRAEPVALDAAHASRQRVGELVYLGGVELRATDPRFGGLSGLRVGADGMALLVSDAGYWVRLRLVERRGRLVDVADAAIGAMPDGAGVTGSKVERDAEALEVDAAGDTAWVAFEARNAVWQYADLSRAEARGLADWRPAATHAPLQLSLWPGGTGPEAMARLADGRLLILSEGAEGRWPGTTAGALLDLAGARPAPPVLFSYRPPAGFSATDAAMASAGTVLVLNRHFTPFTGVAARLCVMAVTEVVPGGDRPAPCREIARLVPPLAVDNMEGVSVVARDGRRYVYLVSDDNYYPLQRTLLLKFAWPEPRPAPAMPPAPRAGDQAAVR